MGQKLSKLFCCRRRHRGIVGWSSAVDLPLPPPPKSEDASSSVEAAQRGRVISPPIPPTPHSEHRPTRSGSLSAEKERSESALALNSEVGGAGGVCVCERERMSDASETLIPVLSLKVCITCPSCAEEPLKPVSGDLSLRGNDICAQKVNSEYSCVSREVHQLTVCDMAAYSVGLLTTTRPKTQLRNGSENDS